MLFLPLVGVEFREEEGGGQDGVADGGRDAAGRAGEKFKEGESVAWLLEEWEMDEDGA